MPPTDGGSLPRRRPRDADRVDGEGAVSPSLAPRQCSDCDLSAAARIRLIRVRSIVKGQSRAPRSEHGRPRRSSGARPRATAATTSGRAPAATRTAGGPGHDADLQRRRCRVTARMPRASNMTRRHPVPDSVVDVQARSKTLVRVRLREARARRTRVRSRTRVPTSDVGKALSCHACIIRRRPSEFMPAARVKAVRIDIVTIFPEFFSVLDVSLLGRARQSGLIDLRVHDLRDFTHDRHRTVDDTPTGGGAGMVMKPEPWGEALDAILGAAAARTDERMRPSSSRRPPARSSPSPRRASSASGSTSSSAAAATRASTSASSTTPAPAPRCSSSASATTCSTGERSRPWR